MHGPGAGEDTQRTLRTIRPAGNGTLKLCYFYRWLGSIAVLIRKGTTRQGIVDIEKSLFSNLDRQTHQGLPYDCKYVVWVGEKRNGGVGSIHREVTMASG